MHIIAAIVLILATTAIAQREQPQKDTSSSTSASPSSGTSSFNSASSSGCPAVWQDVASGLSRIFRGCNDPARGAIRAPFHDCINNGCDGSLILGGECSRREDAGLLPTCNMLGNMAKQYNVGTADMIQFAASFAIATCPLGPQVRALVGRKDSSTPAPEGGVPGSRDPIPKILAAFAAVGMSTTDTVALVGAHTAARQLFDDPSQAGKTLDTIPSRWDVTFYQETKAGTAPYSLSSDRRMTNDSQTSSIWDRFAGSQEAWNSAFTSAFERFTVVGNDVSSLQDCSSLLP